MNIAISLNEQYFHYTYVMLYSLFRNNSSGITVYVLNRDLSDYSIKEFINLAETYGNKIVNLRIDEKTLVVDLPTTKAWSLEIYFRLMLPDLLPYEVDKILYLDVDMIVDKKINDLYETELGEYVFGVVEDILPTDEVRVSLLGNLFKNGHKYFNSGMLLINVKVWRKKYNIKFYLSVLKEIDYKVLAPDQDLLNYVHSGEVKYLDGGKYNVFCGISHCLGRNYKDIKDSAYIIHFTGTKPWDNNCLHFDIEMLWWDYAKETKYYDYLIDTFIYRMTDERESEKNLMELENSIMELTQRINKAIELKEKIKRLTERR